MNRTELNDIMSELAQYNRIADETAAIIEGLKDKLKAYMNTAGLAEIIGDEHKATYKEVISTRLDSKAFKADMPDTYDKYTRETHSMRFTFS